MDSSWRRYLTVFAVTYPIVLVGMSLVFGGPTLKIAFESIGITIGWVAIVVRWIRLIKGEKGAR